MSGARVRRCYEHEARDSPFGLPKRAGHGASRLGQNPPENDAFLPVDLTPLRRDAF